MTCVAITAIYAHNVLYKAGSEIDCDFVKQHGLDVAGVASVNGLVTKPPCALCQKVRGAAMGLKDALFN